MKCENLTFESSENGLCKEVQGCIGQQLQNTCIEYGDISGIFSYCFRIILIMKWCDDNICIECLLLFSDNSPRDNDDVYTIDSQTTSRNSPSVMNETSNDSDIKNDSFPTSNLLPQVLK